MKIKKKLILFIFSLLPLIIVSSTSGDCYNCNNQSLCININQICDGIIDCPNGSDEEERICINKLKCNQTVNCKYCKYLSATNEYKCYCNPGFTYQNFTCQGKLVNTMMRIQLSKF